MRRKLRVRAAASARQDGFTMIEVLTVLVIILALLAILVPAYVGFAVRASDSSAKADLRAAMPAVEAYRADNGSYVGMTVSALLAYDNGLATGLGIHGSPTATSYCLTDTIGGRVWSVSGPGAAVADYRPNGTCS